MTEKSPEELYNERQARVLAAARCQQPDRIPVFGPFQKYPYQFGGITFKQAMNDYALAREACHKFLDYFQPDVDFGPIFAYPAKAMETIGWKAFKWPGHGLSDDVMYQYIDGEYMTADEYDEFVYDPSGFMFGKWAPRQFTALQGFAQLPPWRRFMWTGWMNIGAIAGPEMQETFSQLTKFAGEINEWWGHQVQYWGELKEKGYPLAFAAWDWPPFDIIGDTLRGTRNVLADMRRRPSKLHDALEVATKIFIEYGSGAEGAPLPFTWTWVHKSTREFMSDAQFKEFYWPSLRDTALALINEGFIPVFFGEGAMANRLEIIAADLPKGRTVWILDRTDMAYAKKTLGRVAALQGNVPLSLLQLSTPEAVREYCRKLIDAAAPGGGFLLDSGAVLHQCKAENVKAMIQAAHEFGVY